MDDIFNSFCHLIDENSSPTGFELSEELSFNSVKDSVLSAVRALPGAAPEEESGSDEHKFSVKINADDLSGLYGIISLSVLFDPDKQRISFNIDGGSDSGDASRKLLIRILHGTEIEFDTEKVKSKKTGASFSTPGENDPVDAAFS